MFSFRKSIWFPPTVLFIAVMTVVIGSFLGTLTSVENESRQVVADYAQGTEDIIQDRIKIFEESLRSSAGIFSGGQNTSQEYWDSYIKATGVKARYPGSQTISYAKVVERSGVESFTKEAKKNTTSSFVIAPSGDREVYAPILYLSPLTQSNKDLVGFDIYTNEARRNTLEKVRDDNEVYLTDAIELLSNDESDSQLGLLMYAPQYRFGAPIATVAERRESIEGYVYTAFKSEVFLGNLLAERENDAISYKIVAGVNPDAKSLYNSSNYKSLDSDKTLTDSFEVNGATWSVFYRYNEDNLLPQAILSRPVTVFVFGVFSALLISGITYLLLRGKSNQLLLEIERETNEAKDSLLSIASHQLRTPATGVKQYLGMVLQGFVGDISNQQKSMLDKAYDSNERQLKTINDILYLARIDSARIVLTKKEVNVNALIKSLHEEVQDDIKRNDHVFVLQLPKKHVMVQADEHMLRMIVENLMTNAIKYTKAGKKIKVTLLDDGDVVRIKVKDQGVGIAKEDYDKLFKEFSRLKNELSKSVSGTGIGLYLAKYLTQLHGGDIELESEVGVGSTFEIILPK